LVRATSSSTTLVDITTENNTVVKPLDFTAASSLSTQIIPAVTGNRSWNVVKGKKKPSLNAAVFNNMNTTQTATTKYNRKVEAKKMISTLAGAVERVNKILLVHIVTFPLIKPNLIGSMMMLPHPNN
jgi:hypothetical protein